MYAVFQIGNRQYRVFNNQIIKIERINIKIGSKVEFNQILFVKNNDSFQIGNPFIKNMKIIAIVQNHELNKKIKIVKFRRRKHSRKLQGHRQQMTKIKITNIECI